MRHLTPTEFWELSYRTTAVLGESTDPGTAVRDLIALLGKALEFDAASFWVVHELRSVLRCSSFWTSENIQFPNFELVTRVRDLAFGQDLPGIAWETRKAVCVSDVLSEYKVARASVAKMDGVRMGIAFPAHRLRRVFGVFEFFGREVEPCPDETIKFFDALGVQIGVFLEHYQINEAVVEDDLSVRLAAERSLGAVLTIDESSTVMFANSAVSSIFGWKPEELVGGSLTRIMPDYLRQVHEQGLARFIATGERHLNWSEIELPGLHKDGYEVPLTLAFGEFWRSGKRIFTGFAHLSRRTAQ